MFLGPRITTVFASRWKALAWSGGVLLTAYCSVPSDNDDGPGTVPNPAGAMVTAWPGGGPPARADSHASPWAISPKPTPAPGR